VPRSIAMSAESKPNILPNIAVKVQVTAEATSGRERRSP
jgi:hypothetical protein